MRGGGRKIYRQKGTGNARHHGNRAPQFTHGGVVFAPKPRDYVINVPKKVRRLAMKSALTCQVATPAKSSWWTRSSLRKHKTKLVAKMLKDLSAGKKRALLVLPGRDESVIRATKQPAGCLTTAYVNTLNVYDILQRRTS